MVVDYGQEQAMTRLTELLSEARMGSASEGDYVEGTADSMAFSERVHGYFAGGSSIMVNRGNRWVMVGAYGIKLAAGGNRTDKAKAMRVLEAVRRKHSRSMDRQQRAADRADQRSAETDWEGLKERTMNIARLLKSVEHKVPRRLYSTKTKQLTKAWSDLDKKRLRDWDLFLSEIEGEIQRAARQ